MSLTDDDVIRGFLGGEAGPVRQVDLWIREVLRHPRLALGGDADDLAQDVRRRLLMSFRGGRFLGASTLRTYVWRAAQHAAIDHLRMRRRRPPGSALEDVTEPADPALSPEKSLLQQERRAIFRRLLDHLGDECRRLFQLIVFDELGYAEIASRLGTTEGAIKVRALRCREKAAAVYKSVTSSVVRRPLGEDDV